MTRFNKIRFCCWVIFLGSFIVAQPINAQELIDRVKGYILLQVEQHGEAWFVRPENGKRYYMKNGEVAYEMMRSFGLGITDTDLEKIELIPDTTKMIESTNTCNPGTIANQVRGRILLQVEQHGEAFYVHPDKCTRIYMKDGEAAFTIMRFLGLGITDKDLQAIPTADGFGLSNGNGSEQMPGFLGDEYDSIRVSLLSSINSERSQKGLATLKLNFSLTTGAQAQADDMTAQQYFDFSNPEGKKFDEWVLEGGYTAHSLAENLAQTNQEISTLVGVWQSQSPISYNNVIKSEYKDLGVGVGEYQGVPIYTVIFARSVEDFFNEQTAGLSNLDQVRSEMLASVNQERANVGLQPLVIINY